MATSNVLIYLNQSFLHFGITKELQKKFPANYFGICATTENAFDYLKKQDLVKFNELIHFPDYLKNTNQKPDYEFLEKFEKKYEIGVWKLINTERAFHRKFNEYYDFKTKEKLLFLEQSIKFYEELLDRVNPNFLLTQTTIGLFDHLLYLLCRQRGVKILMLRPTRIGYHLIISEDFNFMDSFKKNSSEPNPNFKNFSDLQNYINNFSLYKQVKNLETTFSISKQKKFKSFLNFLFSNNDYKKHFNNYGKSKLNLLSKGTALGKKIKMRKIELFINKHTLKEIPQNFPFAYFPLHFEPEKILLVDFPYFDNQIEIIKKISLSLPIKFQLYVKDHPTMAKQLWRESSFYREILSLPNVKLLHYSITPREILSKTSLVFAIAGSTGLEAAIYNKPSIVFSDMEWTYLPSVTYVKSLTDLSDVIQESLASKVDFDITSNYLNELDKNSFEFDYFTINKNFNQNFRYHGYFQDIEYPTEKMTSFFNEHESDFELLANEHLKKIQFHLNNDSKSI